MKVLVTNDDGIHSEGLWALARELKNIGDVVVIAPDREQSAIGTAITHNQPVRVQKISPVIPGIETCSVQGTPGDCVILAVEKLYKNDIDAVVSGINNGLNLGTDVFISGTVGAALQGFLRGLPSLAVSLSGTDKAKLDSAAKTACCLLDRIRSSRLSGPALLNLNLPDLHPGEIKGAKITSLATESHDNGINEGHDGRRAYFWLTRKRKISRTQPEDTDIWAVDNGYISLTPLHVYGNGASKAADGFCSDILCHELVRELKKGAQADILKQA
jgi:5'-nucleotidase